MYQTRFLTLPPPSLPPFLTSAAQFRGGMKAHGPVQRDFSFKLNKKVRALGVRMALSAKAREGEKRREGGREGGGREVWKEGFLF